MRGVHNQGHGCLTRTQEATWLHCPVLCFRGTRRRCAPPAPFPRSTLSALPHTHTKTHAWSPPPPLLLVLGERREREAGSSQERTLVELYKVRQSKHRPLEISRRICFLTSLLYHVSCYFTWGKSSPLSPDQVMTSRHPQPIKSQGSHGQKGHVYSPDILRHFLTKKLLLFRFSILVLLQYTLGYNAYTIGLLLIT